MDYKSLKTTFLVLLETAQKRKEHYQDFAEDDITDIITVMEVLFDEWKEILTSVQRNELNNLHQELLAI